MGDWWKQVVVPNGLGGRFVLETKNETHQDRNGLWADEVQNGQTLSLRAGGVLGYRAPCRESWELGAAAAALAYHVSVGPGLVRLIKTGKAIWLRNISDCRAVVVPGFEGSVA